MENQLALVNLIFLYISPLKSLNLVLGVGTKLDGHRGTWAGCIEHLKTSHEFSDTIRLGKKDS